MQGVIRHGIFAGCLTLALLPLEAAAMALVKPKCLDELAIHSQTWAECTHKFSRTDSRCKTSTTTMSATMQQCAAEGKTRQQIDAAMNAGFRKAGTRP